MSLETELRLTQGGFHTFRVKAPDSQKNYEMTLVNMVFAESPENAEEAKLNWVLSFQQQTGLAPSTGKAEIA